MKFCPECGASLQNVEICECGYDVKTGKVNQQIRNKQIEKSKNINPGHYNIPTGIVYIDEIPKNLPPTYTMNQSGFVLISKIKECVGYYANGGEKLGDSLYKLYKNNNMDKETYLKVLQDLLDLKIDDNINIAINKIKND